MSDEIIQIDGQTSMFPEDDLPQIEEQKFMTLDEMREHEWYVSWSGGKDSTATIILMREHNIPIKKITYEHLRIHRLGGKKQSILVTLGIDEEECFGICQKYDLLSPLYSLGTGRDGCWFCPNAPKRERHRLRTERPDLYAHILWMIGITSEWWTQPYFTSVNGWCKDYVEEHMDDDQLSLFKEESNDTHREKLCESCNGLPD